MEIYLQYRGYCSLDRVLYCGWGAGASDRGHEHCQYVGESGGDDNEREVQRKLSHRCSRGVYCESDRNAIWDWTRGVYLVELFMIDLLCRC